MYKTSSNLTSYLSSIRNWRQMIVFDVRWSYLTLLHAHYDKKFPWLNTSVEFSRGGFSMCGVRDPSHMRVAMWGHGWAKVWDGSAREWWIEFIAVESKRSGPDFSSQNSILSLSLADLVSILLYCDFHGCLSQFGKNDTINIKVMVFAILISHYILYGMKF